MIGPGTVVSWCDLLAWRCFFICTIGLISGFLAAQQTDESDLRLHPVFRTKKSGVRASSSQFHCNFRPVGDARAGNIRGLHSVCIGEHRSRRGHLRDLVIAAFSWHSPRTFSSGTIFCLCWWPWCGLFSCVLECWHVSLPERGSRVVGLPFWHILGWHCMGPSQLIVSVRPVGRILYVEDTW